MYVVSCRKDFESNILFGDANLYQSAIDCNMEFLRQTIETADLNRLRRTCYSLSAPASRAA